MEMSSFTRQSNLYVLLFDLLKNTKCYASLIRLFLSIKDAVLIIYPHSSNLTPAHTKGSYSTAPYSWST